MREERMLILRLLQENKITAEEAEKLLTALNQGNVDEKDKSSKNRTKEMENKLKDLGDTLEDWSKDFSKKLDNIVKEVEPKLKKVTKIVVDKTTSAFDEISKEFKKEDHCCSNNGSDDDFDDDDSYEDYSAYDSNDQQE
ncbi:MAG: hypothetical protein GX962_06025 [Epulopiscium sp.]|nr:hypothetical protein [Candidatus Epulonipiscium sp.]